MRLRKNKPSPQETVLTAPAPTTHEYVELKDGTVYHLRDARVSHYINGKVIAGYRIVDGAHTLERVVLVYSSVVKHRCLDLDSTGKLVVNETRMPRSLF